jgi:lipopolysaccharide transport system ATP-binding protein
MGNIAISARGISKVYRVGATSGRAYPTFRDKIADTVMAPFRRRMRDTEKARMFQALSDVSFEVKQGEVVGVIGRNGAGKSTLLKILARITPPSAGVAEVHGRLGSLLEVGTGFHQELTGRENVQLNGAILGMGRAEVSRKFDEIVDFAEIGDFIDTPVKHYSSGMYMRLAFGVAAHLDPDILIVDEVLAVGDANFQKKCLGKMQNAGEQGRAVIFVSHNMPAVTRLCGRVLLLDGGRLIADGPSSQVVASYLRTGLGTTAAREWPEPGSRPSGPTARLCAVRACTEDGKVLDSFDIRRPIRVELEYEVLGPGHVVIAQLGFTNDQGTRVMTVFDVDPEWRGRPRPAGRYITAAVVPGNFLAEGTLFVTASMFTTDPFIRQFFESDVVAFQVVDTIDGDSARGDYGFEVRGVVRPILQWSSQLLT